jgi:hypothetical protein
MGLIRNPGFLELIWDFFEVLQKWDLDLKNEDSG